MSNAFVGTPYKQFHAAGRTWRGLCLLRQPRDVAVQCSNDYVGSLPAPFEKFPLRAEFHHSRRVSQRLIATRRLKGVDT